MRALLTLTYNKQLREIQYRSTREWEHNKLPNGKLSKQFRLFGSLSIDGYIIMLCLSPFKITFIYCCVCVREFFSSFATCLCMVEELDRLFLHVAWIGLVNTGFFFSHVVEWYRILCVAVCALAQYNLWCQKVCNLQTCMLAHRHIQTSHNYLDILCSSRREKESDGKRKTTGRGCEREKNIYYKIKTYSCTLLFLIRYINRRMMRKTAFPYLFSFSTIIVCVTTHVHSTQNGTSTRKQH